MSDDMFYVRVCQERDQLRTELAAAKEHLGIAIDNAAGWRKRTAERRQGMKALAADNARLRKDMEEIHECCVEWLASSQDVRVGMESVQGVTIAALAATPAQSLAAHDAAVKVAVLREVAEKLRLEESTNSSMHAEFVEAEADRIEKEAQRG